MRHHNYELYRTRNSIQKRRIKSKDMNDRIYMKIIESSYTEKKEVFDDKYYENIKEKSRELTNSIMKFLKSKEKTSQKI